MSCELSVLKVSFADSKHVSCQMVDTQSDIQLSSSQGVLSTVISGRFQTSEAKEKCIDLAKFFNYTYIGVMGGYCISVKILQKITALHQFMTSVRMVMESMTPLPQYSTWMFTGLLALIVRASSLHHAAAMEHCLVLDPPFHTSLVCLVHSSFVALILNMIDAFYAQSYGTQDYVFTCS